MVWTQNLKNTKQALVVVGDHETAVQIAQVLEKEGFSVTSVDDGQVGFRRATTEHFHLMVVNIHLDGWDGVETINSLALVAEDLPVIILTQAGASPDDIRAKLTHPLVAGVLACPVDDAALSAVVKNAVTMR